MPVSEKKIPCVVIIVAAGSGERMGGDIPKQYQHLGGACVLRRTIEAFLGHPAVDAVQVVIRPGHEAWYQAATEGLSLLPVVYGGQTRQESVREGLKALSAPGCGRVLIHDAARPLVSSTLIQRVVDGLATSRAVLPVLPVADTLRRTDAVGTSIIPRDGVVVAQTPQGFCFSTIHEAHQQPGHENFTDDVALAEHLDIPVQHVQGERENFKLTTEEDMIFAAKLLSTRRETRVGHGYDVHRLIPAALGHITLCGVKIPHTLQLEGHSDADVALHALVDALLGAMSEGDIGQHFPPSDIRWKGAESHMFLAHAMSLLREKKGVLIHADVTIICESPKLSPHRDAMRQRIAEICGVDISRISVKATTTEKLGFTGREEGIASQATATIQLEVTA